MNLDDLRKNIDRVDSELIRLLNERTDYVLEVGKNKLENGTPIYSPARESEVYKKIEEISGGPLPADALKCIYREIMSASLSLEKHLKIAYLGPEASFTNLAALSKFGASVEYVPADNISDVFLEVDKGHADYGVIPIENSIEGAVRHSLDMFIDSEVKICNEIFFEIKHNLVSSSAKANIKKIYSHPQVFAQCRNWLKINMPKAELIEMASTTAAAKRASKEDGAAAIGSKLAGLMYNLDIIEESIEDSAHNVTRFLVIGKEISNPSGNDKTSIVCSIKDKVGALFDILKPFSDNEINMTKIESRPSKLKAWDYYFFIDLEGHINDSVVSKTVKEIEEKVRFLKVLGSYPVTNQKES